MPILPSPSGGKVIKHLLATRGPLTNQALREFVPQYKKQLVSTSHMKNYILKSLQGQNVIQKSIHHNPAELGDNVAPAERTKKSVFVWNFVRPEDAEKYKTLNLEDAQEQK